MYDVGPHFRRWRTGLFRLYVHTRNEIDFAMLPAQAHTELVAFWSSPSYHRSVISSTGWAPI